MEKLQTLMREGLAQSEWGVLGNQGGVLGIDLGSYGLRAALVDLGSRSFSSLHRDLPVANPDAILEHAVTLAQQLLQEASMPIDRLLRVGVGFNGPVDPRFGTIILSPRRPGWENYPLQERIEQAFDAVTLIDNDANLIALAEATFGIGRGTQHLFYLHLSSGVGGGMVLDGRLYHGATSTAGEIGHAVVGMGWDGKERPEMLEQYISINGLTRRAAQLGLQTDNLEDIFSDTPVGRQVTSEVVTLLGTRIAQIIALLDPQMVVLGGIVVRIGGEPLLSAIREQVNQFIAPQFARPVQIVASVLGPDAVSIGALARALESLQD
jgi:glucokinase